MVRIATYINTIPAAIEMIETCAKKGYHTTVNIMAVSKAQESELNEALEMLGKSSVEVIYLVDSYGSCIRFRYASWQNAIWLLRRSTANRSASMPTITSSWLSPTPQSVP